MTQAVTDTLDALEEAFAGIDTDDGASILSHFRRDFASGDVTLLTLDEVERVGLALKELKELALQNAMVG